MRPSTSFSSASVPICARSVRSVTSQRRCFLIDSLLEERQKRLAATEAAKRGANAFNPQEEPKREEMGKETMPDLRLEDKEATNFGENGDADSEETAGEETLPTFEEEKETRPSDCVEQSDQRMGSDADRIDSDKKGKALLETLAKLVPEAVRQGDDMEGRADGQLLEESAQKEEDGERGETALGQARVSAEFLHKFQLFQQQLASAAAASASWPFMVPNQSHISPNCFRLPFLPSPSLPFLNRMPKCFASSSNPWRQLMPLFPMAPTAKCRIKMPDCELRNETLNKNLPQAINDNCPYGSPANAVLASISALRAATATASATSSSLSAQNSVTNGSRKGGNANEANLTNKSGNRSGRRATAQQRQQTNGSRSGRSSNAKKYRCDICDKTFSRSNTLITHKRIHTGEKPFRCEHCGRAFRQPGNLTRHAYTHTTVKPFVCAECGKAFNRASNLQSHVRVHSAPGTKSAENGASVGTKQCKRCQTNFETRAELRAHRC